MIERQPRKEPIVYDYDLQTISQRLLNENNRKTGDWILSSGYGSGVQTMDCVGRLPFKSWTTNPEGQVLFKESLSSIFFKRDLQGCESLAFLVLKLVMHKIAVSLTIGVCVDWPQRTSSFKSSPPSPSLTKTSQNQNFRDEKTSLEYFHHLDQSLRV